MGKIEVKPPKLNWAGKDLEAIYSLLQKTTELGFLYKESIKAHIKENENRGTLWAAYIDGVLAGVATVGSRRIYPHLARHGEIAVVVKYRRQRIGTALYFIQVLQGILEGRRELEDTIIPQLSPWMCGGPTCSDGIGFLPSLEYTHYGTLPKRTGGFKDIQLWGKHTTEVQIFEDRIPKDCSFELDDTPKMRATYEKNMKNYEKREPRLVDEFSVLLQWVSDVATVNSKKEEKEKKPDDRKKGLIY